MDPPRRTARDAISPHTLRVAHHSRPAELAKQIAAWSITHCLVFDDECELLGVVELRLVTGPSELRVFSDLVPRTPAPRVAAGTPLEDVALLMQSPSTSAALVHDETDQLLGLITRESLLTQLLLHQQHMTEAADRLATERAFLDRRLEALARKRTSDARHAPLDLDSLARALDHELSGPAGHMVHLAEALEQETSLDLSPASRSALQRLRTDAQYLERLVSNVQAMNEVARGSAAITLVNVDTVVARAVAAQRALLQEYSAEVEVGPLPTVPSHEPTLVRSFETLLLFAARIAEADTRRTIRVYGDHLESCARIWIECHGFNVPSERVPQLFARSGRQREAWREDHGLEVLFVTAALRRVHSDLWAESWTPAGSRFCIQIPVSHRVGVRLRNENAAEA